MKRAYLVYGPEATGNRLMGRCLIACGCIGDPSHDQRWEQRLPTSETPIVWVRSFPLGVDHRWPSVPDHLTLLQERGYRPSVFVMVRDPNAVPRSQVRARHTVRAAEAEANARRAYRHILDGFAELDFQDWEMVPLEALVLRPQAFVTALAQRHGLNPPQSLEAIYDPNGPYYPQ